MTNVMPETCAGLDPVSELGEQIIRHLTQKTINFYKTLSKTLGEIADKCSAALHIFRDDGSGHEEFLEFSIVPSYQKIQ